MPVLIKETNRDLPTDGFDPASGYQMIPLGGTRDVAVETGDFKAELFFTRPDISSMSNFRILQQKVPNLFPLPGPGVQVNRIVLPEKSFVQFTLSGRQLGETFLEGADRLGADPEVVNLVLDISVKPHQRRTFAVCYLFDQIHRDKGKRQPYSTFFREITALYERQANTSIINIEGRAADGPAAKTATLRGSMGKEFDLLDFKLLGRVIRAVENDFPGLFDRTMAVVMPLPVQIKRLPKQTRRTLGIAMKINRGSDNRTFVILFIGSTRTTESELIHTIAHEIGHSFGLAHHPQPPSPSRRRQPPRPKPDPDLLPDFMHNLMFPFADIQSRRLNRDQIENIHAFIPPFRVVSIP